MPPRRPSPSVSFGLLLVVLCSFLPFPAHAFFIQQQPSLRATPMSATTGASSSSVQGMEQVLIVELGFGCDQHGQDATKAAIKACRNAIEWNSLPAMRQLIPSGSYDDMKIRLQLAVPGDPKAIDQEQVKKVFPYGKLLPIEFQKGGMLAKSGIALPEMGDKNDDWVVVVAAVTVGW